MKHSNLKLEYRVLKLERLFLENKRIYEDDSIDVKLKTTRRHNSSNIVYKSLFSRKYDDVKNGIDAGLDPRTETNEKDISPLVYACRDPKGTSGDIVELLLNNGADPNDYDTNKNVIFTALKYNNLKAVQSLVRHCADISCEYDRMFPIEYALSKCSVDDESMKTYMMLVTPKLATYHMMCTRFLEYFTKRDIPSVWYKVLIDKAYSTKDSFETIIYSKSGEFFEKELRNNLSALTDKYIEVVKEFPPLDSWNAGILTSNQFAMNKLFDIILMVSNGKLKVNNVYNYLQVAKKVIDTLNESSDFVLKFITPAVANEMAKTDTGCYDLEEAICFAIDTKNIEFLLMIAKEKLSALDGNRILLQITFDKSNDRDVTSAALRIVNNCIDDDIDHNAAIRIKSSNNKYLIDWAIDMGFGQILINEDESGYKMSNYCKDALTEAGFNINNRVPISKSVASSSYKYAVRIVKDGIAADVWDKRCRDALSKFPELLKDKEIITAVKDNPDSITARQLQRQIDTENIEKEQEDIYDF